MIFHSRRRFLQGLGALTLGSALPSCLFSSSHAAPSPPSHSLTLSYRTLEVNGRAARVYGLFDHSGQPGLRLQKKDGFHVALSNQTQEPTLIHWHGLTPPWEQDGVPGMPSPLLTPGNQFLYDFPLSQSGTHWMHAHTLQEQTLLAAPLIVHEETATDEQDIVILLHDFSFKTPEDILHQLQTTQSPHGSHAGHAMMDLNDVEHDAYLANDRTLHDPDIISVEPGGFVRLRLINGAASTAFTIDLGLLSGDLVAVDGMDVHPIRGNRFPLTMGQRIDIRLKLPKTRSSWPLLMKREGAKEQTGIVLAPARAIIKKIPMHAAQKGPILDLSLERRLRSTTPLSPKNPDVEATYHLTGSMSPYTWQITLAQSPTQALSFKQGDRVHITLNNHSMMAHPIHLHGHHFQVIRLNGQTIAGAVRDTLLIPPMAQATIAFDANNPGKKWAFHCHHLYHMVTGMMTFLEYRT